MAIQKQYNYNLDFIKGIACMFVVFMHCEFPGIMGAAVQAVSRFCVPFFFMVSGYFCFKPLVAKTELRTDKVLAGGGISSIGRKLKHIGKITFWASVFYLAFVLLQQSILNNQNFILSVRDVFNWLVFNQPRIIAGQYWFLFALLYAYTFYGILECLRLRRFAYILAAMMFVVYVAMAQGAHLAGYHVPNMFYRNWLVEAFPYFMLGHWIHENQDRINISNKALITIIVTTTLLCWVERWFMGRDFGVNIVTIPQVFALFVYGVKNPRSHEGIVQRLGRDSSMLVYILHPAVWHSLQGVYNKMEWNDNMPALYMMPILVLGLSVLFSIVFNKLMEKVKKKPSIA